LFLFTPQGLCRQYNKPSRQRLACVRFKDIGQLLLTWHPTFGYQALPTLEAGRTKEFEKVGIL
jgi:hypothetical protein